MADQKYVLCPLVGRGGHLRRYSNCDRSLWDFCRASAATSVPPNWSKLPGRHSPATPSSPASRGRKPKQEAELYMDLGKCTAISVARSLAGNGMGLPGL